MERLYNLYGQHQVPTARMRATTLCLLVFSGFISCITLAVLFSTLHIPLPSVFQTTPPELTWENSSDYAKERFLEFIQTSNERELAGQAHFITEVIKGTNKKAIKPKDIAVQIVHASRDLNYDPVFVAAIMKSESNYIRRARSHVGARGLMQIMPATGKHIADTEGFTWKGVPSLSSDPDYNIRLGIAYLKQLEGMFQGDLRKVLIAYNWGPGNLRQAMKGRARVPKVSLKYTRTILADYKKWRLKYRAKKDQYKYMNASYLHS